MQHSRKRCFRPCVSTGKPHDNQVRMGQVGRRRVEPPAHSRVIHPGEPAEEVYVQHLDGSYSGVQIAAVNDELWVALRPSTTHETRLRGL